MRSPVEVVVIYDRGGCTASSLSIFVAGFFSESESDLSPRWPGFRGSSKIGLADAAWPRLCSCLIICY